MPMPFADILNEGQQKRLTQLMLQFDAPMTLLDPRHGEALNLSEDQRQEIGQIIQEMMPRPPMGQGGPGFGGPGGPPQGGQRGPGQGGQGQGGQGQGGQGQFGQGQGGQNRQGGQMPEPPKWSEMQAKKAAAMKAALKQLSDTQRQTWSRLTGPEFTKWEEPKRPQD
jgi:hypothetical protein